MVGKDERRCGGRLRFKSERSARNAIRENLSGVDQLSTDVIHCEACGGWHHAPLPTPKRMTRKFIICERKMRYPTVEAAQRGIDAIHRHERYDNRPRVQMYDCPYCGEIHIGHTPKNAIRATPPPPATP